MRMKLRADAADGLESGERGSHTVRTRNLVVIGVGLVVATAVATTIVLNLQPKEDAMVDYAITKVIVSKEDIPANQLLDPLIEEGFFVEISVPPDMLVDGAITDLRQLRGSRTAAVILANEQIPAGRLKH